MLRLNVGIVYLKISFFVSVDERMDVLGLGIGVGGVGWTGSSASWFS